MTSHFRQLFSRAGLSFLFMWLNKTPSDSTLLGKTFRRFLWCWLLCLFFLTGSFKVSGLLFLATGTPPRLLRPVKISTSSELYPGYFWLLYFLPGFFVTFLSRALRFWVAFFTHKHFFSLNSFPTFLDTFLWLRCGWEHPIQDPPLHLPSHTCSFRLTHGLLIYQLRQWATK